MRSAVIGNVNGVPHKFENGKLYKNTLHSWDYVIFNAMRIDGWKEVVNPNKDQQAFIEKQKGVLQ